MMSVFGPCLLEKGEDVGFGQSRFWRSVGKLGRQRDLANKSITFSHMINLF